LNILFITANRLGDAVLSTGLLGALIDRHPEARITVACGPTPAPLFSVIPEVARVIVLIKRPYHGHWLDLWLETIGTVWDLVLDIRNTAVSRLVRRRSLRVFQSPAPGQHMVEALSALIDARPPAAPQLWLDSAALEQVAGAIPRETPLLALAPGANSIGKRWPANRFAALASRLLAPEGCLAGGSAVLLGSAGERAELGPILAALSPERVIDLVGRTDPLLAAAWLARAELYVGNDSGLTHLAAAAGAPTLALFGPGLPARYRPWGPWADYLIAEDDPDRTVDMCKIDDSLALAEMEKLSVDHVCLAAETLYRRTRKP
jgi:lipopolysaccharide export system permease protein